MEENENLKLEVQGLRSLMQGFGPAAEAAALQPPSASQPPAGFQVRTSLITVPSCLCSFMPQHT